jgi:hypothetical protein
VANIKVLLYDQSGVEYDVSYINEIPMSLNFLIADIRNPEKRNATFSKTIIFPATKEINIFFRSIWQMNVDLTTFNPNLKCGIYYYIDNIEQLRGDLQLLKINVDGDGAAISYETSAVGRLGNLFISIGDKLMTGNPNPADDLDFSGYNHILNKTNVVNSWSAAVGSGYVYPLINYGLNNINTDSEYHVKHLRAAIYKYEVVNKIFSSAGKTFTSNYLNSTYFKSQILPSVEEAIVLSSTDTANSQFYAGRSSNQNLNTSLTYNGTVSQWELPSTNYQTVIFNDDSNLPYNDAGLQYNTATGVFTCGIDNVYNLTTILNYELSFNNSGSAAKVLFGGLVFILLEKFSGTWTTVANVTATFTNTLYPTLIVPNQSNSIAYANISMVAGEQFRVRAAIQLGSTIILKDVSNVDVTTGASSVDLRIKTGSSYYCSLVSNTIIEGYTVELNQAIPRNVKQIDWLTTEFKAANLYMDIDKNNDNNYIIEPRESFYTGLVDWSDKLDLSIQHEVYPMGDLDFKRREFSYKSDSDQYNETYYNAYKEVYGFKFKDITNDFVKSVNKTELIYSPTPLVGNNVNGLILPVIRKNDNGTFKPTKGNIRSLYYGGVIPLSYGSWTLKSISGDTVYTTYPFAGDCDNPYNPTLSLLWDTPKKVYYNYPAATYTDNNSYNRFYSRQINQITDKNSKIVKAYFNLDKSDIHDFDFRKVVYVGKPLDSYFYVNAIPNYDVLNPKSTMVELLKLADYNAFMPTIISVPDEEPISTERLINGNYSNGTNNNNYGNNSHIVGGSGNFISQGAQDVQLTNCTNVIVDSDVVGYVGTGLSNVRVTRAENGTVSITGISGGGGGGCITILEMIDTIDSNLGIDTCSGGGSGTDNSIINAIIFG